MDALQRVTKQCKKRLSSLDDHLTTSNNFNWKDDLKDDKVVVGALRASNDSCLQETVTTHGYFTFDANEKVALRVCDEALDDYTSTKTVQRKFVALKLGYRFFYGGKRQLRHSKMRLPS